MAGVESAHGYAVRDSLSLVEIFRSSPAHPSRPAYMSSTPKNSWGSFFSDFDDISVLTLSPAAKGGEHPQEMGIS
jgi:hypothetical protein